MRWSGVFRIYPESFKARVYSRSPFRMIGFIDVDIKYNYGMERVTLLYFRSSGTNSGKIKGMWYPIVGLKTKEGKFTEFTPYINYVLTQTTRTGKASKGWLAKSLFFNRKTLGSSMYVGYSTGRHYKDLLWIGKTLRKLYDSGAYEDISSIDNKTINKITTANIVYNGNKHTQRENFEKFVEDIYNKV